MNAHGSRFYGRPLRQYRAQVIDSLGLFSFFRSSAVAMYGSQVREASPDPGSAVGALPTVDGSGRLDTRSRRSPKGGSRAVRTSPWLIRCTGVTRRRRARCKPRAMTNSWSWRQRASHEVIARFHAKKAASCGPCHQHHGSSVHHQIAMVQWLPSALPFCNERGNGTRYRRPGYQEVIVLIRFPGLQCLAIRAIGR